MGEQLAGLVTAKQALEVTYISYTSYMCEYIYICEQLARPFVEASVAQDLLSSNLAASSASHSSPAAAARLSSPSLCAATAESFVQTEMRRERSPQNSAPCVCRQFAPSGQSPAQL